jgi:NAD/NADP transhydrogenase alpha subunit
LLLRPFVFLLKLFTTHVSALWDGAMKDNIIRIGVPQEDMAGETRVALTPNEVRTLADQGHEIVVAAARVNKIQPVMTTAAGTIPPARVLVLGARVAGLQAIATACRLGVVVHAYDIRAAAKDQWRASVARSSTLSRSRAQLGS